MSDDDTGPEMVSADTLAHFFSLTPRRVQQLARDGIIPKPETRGRYLLAESIRAYVSYLNGKAQQRETASVARDIRAEQLRKIRLANDQMEGRSVPLDEVQQAFNAAGRHLSRMFDSLRGRLTPRIKPLLREGASTAELGSLIDDEQRRIRIEFSDALAGVADTSNIRPKRAAKKKTKPRRVGGR